MKRWPIELKNQVLQMRRKGATYWEILQKYPIAKSTLSVWCKNLPKPKHLYFENQSLWLAKIRPKSNEVIKNKRRREIEQIAERVKLDVNSWLCLGEVQIQKAMLSLLYWAEGQKLPVMGSPVKFANTDPRLVLLFVKLLRRCYLIDESKLRVKLHLHWYHDIKKTKKFWSDLLQIDEKRFTKTYLKKRSKSKRFRKNYAGICFVIYSSVDLRWEIMDVAYNIQEKITGKNKNLRPWLNG